MHIPILARVSASGALALPGRLWLASPRDSGTDAIKSKFAQDLRPQKHARVYGPPPGRLWQGCLLPAIPPAATTRHAEGNEELDVWVHKFDHHDPERSRFVGQREYYAS